MKLGICYMVFDGVELLEFAITSIRSQVDHVSVTYQDTSYFGNPAKPDLVTTLERLRDAKLVDQLIYFEPDLSIHHKENELNLRNIGLDASIAAGCTHHISADVDEFYKPDELAYVKEVMDDYDFCMVPQIFYYKEPTYLVHPVLTSLVTLIHPVANRYEYNRASPSPFPFKIETTRRFGKYDKYKVFTREEFTLHHMSYVRRDIRQKFANSDNARFYKVEEFVARHDKYKLGERVCLLPDYLNRKTIQVENIFGIYI